MQARREARRSGERLRIALKAARAGVYETDFEEETFWCSPEFVQVVGREMTYAEAAQLGWPMVHPDDLENVRADIAFCRARLAEGAVETRVILPSGVTRWIQLQAEYRRKPDGSPAKVIGLVLDIDARKRQEIALEEARREAQANAERLGFALEAAHAGVFETDLDRRTFWCSPEFAGLMGRQMTFEEATGYDWPMTHPQDADFVRRRVGESVATPAKNVMESRIVLRRATPNGSSTARCCTRTARAGCARWSASPSTSTSASARSWPWWRPSAPPRPAPRPSRSSWPT